MNCWLHRGVTKRCVSPPLRFVLQNREREAARHELPPFLKCFTPNAVGMRAESQTSFPFQAEERGGLSPQG